ncbi:MAG: PQQ-dependent sugar dehydrogenase [Rubrivivax sp.]|nr:PQQ-dependent sugar dehydrogenase [Rubrivivax sp.]
MHGRAKPPRAARGIGLGLLAVAVAAALALLALPAFAQQQAAPAAGPAAPPAPAASAAAEEPFWAKGRPKSEVAMRMAPVPAFPIPTAADQLPIAKMKLPPGFKAEVYASGILDARGMRQGDKGTVFVSSLFVAGKLYAVVDKGGTREVKTLAEKLFLPNGIEFHKGALYVATPKDIVRYDAIEDNLDKLPAPVTIYDKLPGDVPHGWKFIKVGPDNKLYVPVGAPCNICESDDRYTKIFRMNLDGSGVEVVAHGMRNTVGFDFHPKTGNLWFTDNQRDWLSEDLPEDELNHVTQPGRQHFGYPYCHAGDFADPEFGWGKSCTDYVKPAAKLGAHAAPLGMRFYTGRMFPAKYQGAIFIARHGPWNRSKKYAADVVVAYPDGKGGVSRVEPFLTGLVENNEYLGRPADVMVMKDGSLLVSDDHNGAIYRITYGGGRK